MNQCDGCNANVPVDTNGIHRMSKSPMDVMRCQKDRYEDEYKCKVNGCDLRAGEIPEKDREMFGGHTHFSHLIAITSRDLDRVTEYLCPKCQARWPRD